MKPGSRKHTHRMNSERLLGSIPAHQSSDESEAVYDMGPAGFDGPGRDGTAAPAAPPASKRRYLCMAVAVGYVFLALASAIGYTTSNPEAARWWAMAMGALLVAAAALFVTAAINAEPKNAMLVGALTAFLLPAAVAAVLAAAILFDAMSEGASAGDAFSAHGRLFWITAPCVYGGLLAMMITVPINLVPVTAIQ